MSGKFLSKNQQRMALAILCTSLLMAGCNSSCLGNKDNEEKPDAIVSQTLAAQVNGKEIQLANLEDLYKRAIEKYGRTGRQVSADIERKVRAGILRKMIDDEIFRQEAESEGIKIDRFERVAALEQFKQKMGGQKAFEIFLKNQKLTEDQMLDTILAEQIREKLVEKAGKKLEISEAEIQSHYEANKNLYTLPELVHARHILLKLSDTDPPEKAALVLKKANQILLEAQDPKNSFASLVQKYSEGPSGKNGGDLGFFPRGKMVKAFEDAAFNAELKKPVGPIKTDFGYHIIYVEEKSVPKTAPLAEVSEQIKEFMTKNKQSREAEKMLFSLRKSAKIQIHDYSMTQKEYKELSTQEAESLN